MSYGSIEGPEPSYNILGRLAMGAIIVLYLLPVLNPKSHDGMGDNSRQLSVPIIPNRWISGYFDVKKKKKRGSCQ